ncbi:MAG: autoinducer synthase [Rhodobacteraceae bacterium]|nr:autoinducer synthase [Paracoccaceae bacterium]
MRSTEITFDNLGETGTLFTALLRARYHHFIEARGWDLPNVRGLEFDQYDTPESIYCAIHEGMIVYGGFRVTPTTARCVNASYMLRDAQLGLLPDLPLGILDEPAPQDPRIWEVSRVFVDDTLSSRERMRVRDELGLTFARLAKDWNIKAFLCLTSVSAALLMRRAGLKSSPAGPRFEAGGETCQAYHLKIDVRNLRSHAA